MTPLQPHGRRQVPPEVLARAGQLLEDGCSVREVCKTLGIDKTTIHRHYPGSGWTRQQSVEFASSVSGLRRRRH